MSRIGRGASWEGPKWVEIPLPEGVSGDVVAACTENLTDEEKRALGEYWAWFKSRSKVDEDEGY